MEDAADRRRSRRLRDRVLGAPRRHGRSRRPGSALEVLGREVLGRQDEGLDERSRQGPFALRRADEGPPRRRAGSVDDHLAHDRARLAHHRHRRRRRRRRRQQERRAADLGVRGRHRHEVLRRAEGGAPLHGPLQHRRVQDGDAARRLRVRAGSRHRGDDRPPGDPDGRRHQQAPAGGAAARPAPARRARAEDRRVRRGRRRGEERQGREQGRDHLQRRVRLAERRLLRAGHALPPEGYRHHRRRRRHVLLRRR